MCRCRQDNFIRVTSLVWPSEPGVKLNSRKPSTSYVVQAMFIHNERSRSTPGPNGISFTVYPGVTGLLVTKSVEQTHNLRGVEKWQRLYIPDKWEAEVISHFPLTSLFNHVEGKVYFTILVKRLTSYLIANGFIDPSVQKGWVPGAPGCLEHFSINREAMHWAKSEKQDPHTIWLDLANAYRYASLVDLVGCANVPLLKTSVGTAKRTCFEDFNVSCFF